MQKQVRLRQALRRSAIKLKMPILSSFNCKTTSLRTLGRALWEGCDLDPEPKNKVQELLLRQKQDAELVDAIWGHLSAQHVHVPAAIPEPPLPALLDEHAKQQHQLELQTHGIVLLRGFVPEETCEWLLSRVNEHRRRHAPTRLTETMSLGRRGSYWDKDWKLPILKKIQERVVRSLELNATSIGDADAKLPPSNSKSVLLVYSEGGENWAHQDDNKDFSFQALLMLSKPGVDFEGGSLYVLDGNQGWAKRSVEFQTRGDLAVFRSNGLFFHGMDEVLEGSGSWCNRIAVGLFHKD